jgi:hypothetical protein
METLEKLVTESDELPLCEVCRERTSDCSRFVDSGVIDGKNTPVKTFICRNCLEFIFADLMREPESDFDFKCKRCSCTVLRDEVSERGWCQDCE